MKKIKRLIEIKRQAKLQRAKIERAGKKASALKLEQDRIVKSFTTDELRLYKEQIERACKL